MVSRLRWWVQAPLRGAFPARHLPPSRRAALVRGEVNPLHRAFQARHLLRARRAALVRGEVN
ncbi:MAG: hypothetical protein ACXWH0_09890, partial [Acidimicrobiia bacterium]